MSDFKYDRPTEKVIDLHPSERNRSSVHDELEQLKYQLSKIMVSVSNIERYNSVVNNYEIDAIRKSVEAAIQRSYRAEQCARGLRVWKA